MDVDFKSVSFGQTFKFVAGFLVVESHAIAPAKQIIVDDPKRGHVQWVLIKHANTFGQCISRRVEPDRLAIEQNLAARGRLIAGEDLHQGTLAGTVLPYQRVDFARFQDQTNAIVGFHTSKILAYIPKLYLHDTSLKVDQTGDLIRANLSGNDRTGAPD